MRQPARAIRAVVLKHVQHFSNARRFARGASPAPSKPCASMNKGRDDDESLAATCLCRASLGVRALWYPLAMKHFHFLDDTQNFCRILTAS